MTDDKWRSMVLDCEEYLKEGETPAERIDREIKDCLSMIKMLEKEKRKSEDLQAEVREARMSELSALGQATDAYEQQKALEAEVERLREALILSRDEIDGYIQQEYPLDHPAHERYRKRDFAANPARIALKEEEESEMSPVKDREDYEV